MIETTRQNLIVIPTGQTPSKKSAASATRSSVATKSSDQVVVNNKINKPSDVHSAAGKQNTNKNNAELSGNKKRKMFRCELCSVRLPYSEQGIKDHMSCKTHYRMKSLYEFGLWPGTLSNSAAGEAEGMRTFKFNDNDGNILCVPCEVIVSDSVSLLQHQMQPHHWTVVQRKGLQNVTPRIAYCDVCDVILGKVFDNGNHIIDQHKKSGGHLVEEASKKLGKSSVPASSGSVGADAGSLPPTNHKLKKQILLEQKLALPPPSADKKMEINFKNMANRLGKKFLIANGMIPPTARWNDLPYINFWLKELTLKMHRIKRASEDLLLGSNSNDPAKVTRAAELKMKYLTLAKKRDAELLKSKMLFLMEHPTVFNLMKEKFGELETAKDEETFMDEDFGVPIPEESSPVAVVEDCTTSVSNKSETYKNSYSEYEPMSAQYSSESDKFVSVNSLEQSSQVPSSIFPLQKSNGKTVEDVSLPSKTSVTHSLPNFNSMLLNLMKKAVNPEPKPSGVDIDQLIPVLLQQEAKRGPSTEEMDPRQKLRLTLLNQLIAERQQKRPSLNFMSDLLSKIIAKKQESMKSASTVDSVGRPETWGGILNSVLKESRSRAVEQEVAERWNSPRLCVIWDGDIPAEKDYIMDVSEYHNSLAAQHQAKDEMIQDKFEDISVDEIPSPRPPSRSRSREKEQPEKCLSPSARRSRETREHSSNRRRDHHSRDRKRRSPTPKRRNRSRDRSDRRRRSAGLESSHVDWWSDLRDEGRGREYVERGSRRENRRSRSREMEDRRIVIVKNRGHIPSLFDKAVSPPPRTYEKELDESLFEQAYTDNMQRRKESRRKATDDEWLFQQAYRF